LRESERRFRDMLNNLEFVAMMLDIAGNITYCNDYFQRLTGWSREEVIGRNWIELFIPPDEADDLRRAFASLVLDRPEVWHHRNEIVTRSGARRLIQWNNTVLRSASGDAIGTASIGEDITDRTLAERELRRSEEHLRIVVNASTDAVWERNAQTGEYSWSDRAYEILGHTRETFQPNLAAVSAIVHTDDVLVFGQAINHYIQDDSPLQVRVRLRHRNGSYIPILVRGQLQRDTGRVVGVFTDLSVVEHAEEQIREQAALIEQTNDAIVVRDFDDRITFWNKGAERLYGWPSTAVLGRRFFEVLHVNREIYQTAKSAVLLNGAWNGEIEKTTAAGKTVIVDASWTLLRNDGGTPKAIFSIDTDITERKALEKQFYRAQRLESLGTLASGIAHDLNNLLMPILMGATLLKRLIPDERTLPAINNIERSVRRGTELVRQVLLFARGTEGVRAPVRMNEIIDEVRAIVRSTFPKNITIIANVPKELGDVTGDSTQLNQVFMNLLVNARDAMPGGGTVTITAAEIDVGPKTVVVAGLEAGHYVMVDVADTGTGMPQDVMDRIFEQFFTTKDLSKGTGLGLSTVHGIMRGHGGVITVSSEVGRGTTFHLYLPARRGHAAVLPEVEAQPPAYGRGEVILLVDDESAILGIMRQTLEAFGYAVLTAENGAQAIQTYTRDAAKIALVVTDMMMPVMDGAALIDAIRRINTDVPIIAVTGQPEGQLDRATTSGATESIAKPFSAEILLRAVSDALHRQHDGH
jgi:PAS domain S-box-containing protein